jgi:hypothetical protein
MLFIVQESKVFQIEITKNYCEIIAIGDQMDHFFCSDINEIIFGPTYPPIVIDIQ